jgi:hypothetical protein
VRSSGVCPAQVEVKRAIPRNQVASPISSSMGARGLPPSMAALAANGGKGFLAHHLATSPGVGNPLVGMGMGLTDKGLGGGRGGPGASYAAVLRRGGVRQPGLEGELQQLQGLAEGMGGLSLLQRGKYGENAVQGWGPLDQMIAESMEAQGAHYNRENLGVGVGMGVMGLGQHAHLFANQDPAQTAAFLHAGLPIGMGLEEFAATAAAHGVHASVAQHHHHHAHHGHGHHGGHAAHAHAAQSHASHHHQHQHQHQHAQHKADLLQSRSPPSQVPSQPQPGQPASATAGLLDMYASPMMASSLLAEPGSSRYPFASASASSVMSMSTSTGAHTSVMGGPGPQYQPVTVNVPGGGSTLLWSTSFGVPPEALDESAGSHPHSHPHMQQTSQPHQQQQQHAPPQSQASQQQQHAQNPLQPQQAQVPAQHQHHNPSQQQQPPQMQPPPQAQQVAWETMLYGRAKESAVSSSSAMATLSSHPTAISALQASSGGGGGTGASRPDAGSSCRLDMR